MPWPTKPTYPTQSTGTGTKHSRIKNDPPRSTRRIRLFWSTGTKAASSGPAPEWKCVEVTTMRCGAGEPDQTTAD